MSKTALEVILVIVLLISCTGARIGMNLYRQHQIEDMAKEMYIKKLEEKYLWKKNRLRQYTHLVYTKIYGPDSE